MREDSINGLIQAVVVAAAAPGGLVCVRKIASDQSAGVESVIDVIRALERMGIFAAAVPSEVPGLIRVTWGGAAIRAIFWFALNYDEIEAEVVGGQAVAQ